MFNIKEDTRTPSPATAENSFEDSMEKPKFEFQFRQKLKQKRFIISIASIVMFVGVITSVILVVMNTSGQEFRQDDEKTTEITTEMNTITTDSTKEATTVTKLTSSSDTTAKTTKKATEFTTVTDPTKPTTSSHTTVMTSETTKYSTVTEFTELTTSSDTTGTSTETTKFTTLTEPLIETTTSSESTVATKRTTYTTKTTEPIESTMSFDTTATTTKETTEFTTVTKPTEPTTSSESTATTTLTSASTTYEIPVTDEPSITTFDTTESTLTIVVIHKILGRSEWNAIPPNADYKKLVNPISRIIVAHTANLTCFDELECKQRVKAIQTSNDQLIDIPFNFLIGGDGNIYEGRGFENEGQHTANPDGSSYNDIGICVAFIGTFDIQPPSGLQVDAFEFFIENFMSEGNITESFYLFSQDQLAKPKIPADALTETLGTWENFYSVIKIYRRDEWNAKDSCRPNLAAEIPIRHLILTDTVTNLCTDFETCVFKVQMVQNVVQGSCIGILSDIQYGFLIGGDGLIFEGRGFDLIGQHTDGYDQDNLGIAFIGNFDINEPSYDLIENSLRFFNDALILGKLSADYQIHARKDTDLPGPGSNIYEEMQKWLRYRKFWDHLKK